MNALVIVDSKFGNTEQVARAIATALAPTFSVRLAKTDLITQITPPTPVASCHPPSD